MHASGVHFAAQSHKNSNNHHRGSKGHHHPKSGSHAASNAAAVVPLSSIDGRPVYPTKAFDVLAQPLPPPPHAAVAAASAAAAAAAAESAWGAPGSTGGDGGFGSRLIHGQQEQQHSLAHMNAKVGTDFLEVGGCDWMEDFRLIVYVVRFSL